MLAVGETLEVTISGATYTVTPAGNGDWSLDLSTASPTTGTLTPLTAGTIYTVTARVSDRSGNSTSDTSANELTVYAPPAIITSGTEISGGLDRTEASSDGGTTVRVSIANTGVIAGNAIQLRWGNQDIPSAAITDADISNGYVDIVVPTATITAVTAAGAPATVPLVAKLLSTPNSTSPLATSGTTNIQVSLTAPTIALTSSTSTIQNGGTATITFTLSEASKDFESTDVTVSGGTLTNFSGVTGFGDLANGFTKYTATFTSNSTANGVISVASSKFSDASGYYFNSDGSDANNTVTLSNLVAALNTARMSWEVGVTDSGYWNGDPTQGGAGRASDLTLNGSLAGTGLSSVTVYYYQDSNLLGTVTWNGGLQRFGGNFSNTTGTTLSAKAFVNGAFYTFANGRAGTEWNTVITVDSTSPLAIDLNGDGIQTTGLDSSVCFDLNVTGSLQRTGWLDGKDAFLVLDANQNGQIDNGSELFGNRTLLADGTPASDGWQALAQHDDNGDGTIDAQDRIFSALQLWVDSNRNGLAEGGELTSVIASAIRSLSLSYVDSQIEQNGNILDGQGKVWLADGRSAAMTDVWFTLAQSGSQESTQHESIQLESIKLESAGFESASLDATMLWNVSGTASGADAITGVAPGEPSTPSMSSSGRIQSRRINQESVTMLLSAPRQPLVCSLGRGEIDSPGADVHLGYAFQSQAHPIQPPLIQEGYSTVL